MAWGVRCEVTGFWFATLHYNRGGVVPLEVVPHSATSMANGDEIMTTIGTKWGVYLIS